MRLSPKQVEEICSGMVDRLVSKVLVRLRCSQKELKERVKDIFIADLRVEDELNEEVKRLLESQPQALTGVDYQKMFEMIKKRLIRDRGLII